MLPGTATLLLGQVRGILCDPTRAQIVRALSTGPLTVTELATALGRTKWVASRHLRVLRDLDFVVPHRRGRSVFYALNDQPAVRSAMGAMDLVARAAA